MDINISFKSSSTHRHNALSTLDAIGNMKELKQQNTLNDIQTLFKINISSQLFSEEVPQKPEKLAKKPKKVQKKQNKRKREKSEKEKNACASKASLIKSGTQATQNVPVNKSDYKVDNILDYRLRSEKPKTSFDKPKASFDKPKTSFEKLPLDEKSFQEEKPLVQEIHSPLFDFSALDEIEEQAEPPVAKKAKLTHEVSLSADTNDSEVDGELFDLDLNIPYVQK